MKKLGIDANELKQNVKGKSFRLDSEKLLDKMFAKSNDKSYVMTLKGDNKNNKEAKKRDQEFDDT